MTYIDENKLAKLGLNNKDIIILKLLCKKKMMKIYEIQRKTKYHWNTCKTHCELLVNKKYVIKVKKNVYKLRFGLRESLIDLFRSNKGLSPSTMICVMWLATPQVS